MNDDQALEVAWLLNLPPDSCNDVILEAFATASRRYTGPPPRNLVLAAWVLTRSLVEDVLRVDELRQQERQKLPPRMDGFFE